MQRIEAASFKLSRSLLRRYRTPLNFTNRCINTYDKGTVAPSFVVSDPISEVNPHVRLIMENNRNWVNTSLQKDPCFFEKVSAPQRPTYLYFGCSDSRVPANEIMGLGPGEVFVHRNIGNQVPGNDLNALSVLEFAVGSLGVTDIIVTGHYDCGAIRAAAKRQDLGLLENWLRLIRDVYRLHSKELEKITDPEERHRAMVELNVQEQCINLYKTGIVQRKRIAKRTELQQKYKEQWLSAAEIEKRLADEVFPRIHGFVFNPKDGILRQLAVDYELRVGNLDHIYGLYGSEGRA